MIAVCYLLQEHGLAAVGLRNNQASLSFPMGVKSDMTRIDISSGVVSTLNRS